MQPLLVGRGIPDYSLFPAGAPVLVLEGRRPDSPLYGTAVFAGRLREPFRPGLALLMHPGPLSTDLAIADATEVVHLQTTLYAAGDPPEGLQLWLEPKETRKTRIVSVLLDTRRIVEEIEAGEVRWPAHLSFAERIQSSFNFAYMRHAHVMETLSQY